MLNGIIVTIALFGVFFLLRLIILFFYRGYFKSGKSGDASGHFIIIRQFKRNYFSKKIDEFVIPNTFHYASGFHKFASLFSNNILKNRSFLPSLLIFSFFSTIFFFSLYLLPNVSLEVFYLTGLVYLFLITNLIFLGPSITYINLSERLLSKITASGYFASLLLYLEFGDLWVAAIGTVVGGVNLISSTFGRQLFLFATPIFAVIYLDITPLLFFVASFILAIVFQPTFFIKSFIGTIKYWKIYNVFVKPTNMENMIRYTNIYTVWYYLRRGGWKMLFTHVSNTEPTRIFFKFPEIVMFVALMIIAPNFLYIALFLSVFIVYVLTSTYRFAHLGESYRYIEYALYFCTPYMIASTVLKLEQYKVLLFSIYFVYVLIIVVILLMINKENLSWKKSEDLLGVFLLKVGLKEEDVVYTISAKLGLDTAARMNTKVFWWQSGGITDPEQYKEYFEWYPYLKKDWGRLFKKHGTTHVLVEKAQLERSKIDYDFSSLVLIVEDEKYIAYKVK